MAIKKYTNIRQPKNDGEHEVAGVVIVAICIFCLLCLIIKSAIGPLSLAVNGFLIGVLGFSSYPLFFALLILGIRLIQGGRLSVPGIYLAGVIVVASLFILILQLATTHSYIDAKFDEYLSNVYSGFTAGGMFFGVIAYGIKSVITLVGAYVLFIAMIFLITALLLKNRIKQALEYNNTEKAEPQRIRFEKSNTSARQVKPLSDNSLFVERIIPTRKYESESGVADNLSPKQYVKEMTQTESHYSMPISNFTENAGKDAEGKFKSKAHEILFGDKSASFGGFGGFTSATSQVDSKPAQSAFLTGYGMSLPPTSNLQQGITESVQSSPYVRENVSNDTPVKPPKFVHENKLTEIPLLPEKDLSDKVIGGEIVNGDIISQRIAEDNYGTFKSQNIKNEAINTEKQVEKPIENNNVVAPKKMDNDFDTRKIEPVQFKPKDLFFPPPSNIVPPVISSQPIVNGDFFGITPAKANEDRFVFEDEDTNDSANNNGKNNLQSANNSDISKPNFTKNIDEDKPNLDTIQNNSSGDIFSKLNDFPLINSDRLSGPRDLVSGISLSKDEINAKYGILDEALDLSEKSFSNDDDNTGYYTELEQSYNEKMFAKPQRQEQKPKPQKPEAQIQIDSYLATTEPKIKPKPQKRRTQYQAPPIEYLANSVVNASEDIESDSNEKATLLEQTLMGLKLPAKVSAITRGPSVTRFELEMPHGIPIKRIEQYVTDIEYYLASSGKIRLETPIPGKRAVGIEVPNAVVDIVGLKDIINSKEFISSSSPITLAIGKDIAGDNIVCNLERMPHLLIAGATGSGKSACLNSIIISILYKSSPEDVRMILIDPKQVEFARFKDMPHLLCGDIITDSQQAYNAFKWLKNEMERRYSLFKRKMVKNIQEYNKSDDVKSGQDEKIPFIILIVDELAELMMSNNRKDLEEKIMSMAQKARAAGIHLILATQRPSVDVITGTIKANLPSRIAFCVKSVIDSRTILDSSGAETLLGRGDMLFAPMGVDEPRRVQGAYVDKEVGSIVDYVREHNPADFDTEFFEAITAKEDVPSENTQVEEEESEFDSLMPKVLKLVMETGTASTSFIQRRFAVGYARASRIIDQMEQHKFIGPLESGKPRAVYISREQYREIFGEDEDI